MPTLGLPWRSVEEFDSDALVQAVERVVIKPDDIEVVMKYRQVVNGKIILRENNTLDLD